MFGDLPVKDLMGQRHNLHVATALQGYHAVIIDAPGTARHVRQQPPHLGVQRRAGIAGLSDSGAGDKHREHHREHGAARREIG